MKNWINKTFMFVLASLTLMSCEKDEDMVFVSEGTTPVLSSSSNNIVLTEDNAAENAVTFKWDASDFGYKAAVAYTIQIDTAGDNFASAPYDIVMGSELEKSYTVEELNSLLTKLEYEPEVAQDLKLRVRAKVSDKVNPVYSNVTTVSVTPYSTYIEPGYLYVPGGYQGWNPGTALALISVEDNGIYTNYISFEDPANLEFKFTAGRNWDLNYGEGATAGSLTQNGANLKVPSADTYQITANLNNMTWTKAQYSWGVIGDATPNGWASDTNLKYINEEGVWKATLPLTAGKIKFRLNDKWDTNYGDDDTSNSVLNAGGADIPIATAGTYEITLDLVNEDGTVTYTLIKK